MVLVQHGFCCKCGFIINIQTKAKTVFSLGLTGIFERFKKNEQLIINLASKPGGTEVRIAKA